MKWPGISVGKMMLVVAVLAADFSLFYHLEHLVDIFTSGMLLFIGLLPMVNIIAFGLPRLLSLGLPRLMRRGRRTPFALGFQVTSLISTFIVVVVFVAITEDLARMLEHVEEYCPFEMDMGSLVGIYRFRARTIGGPPVSQPPAGLFETCWNALWSLCGCDPEVCASVAVVMVFFSLPPFLLSLAGGLVVRTVVRLRSRSAIAPSLPGEVA
jgi:hypothetical protein